MDSSEARGLLAQIDRRSKSTDREDRPSIDTALRIDIRQADFPQAWTPLRGPEQL